MCRGMQQTCCRVQSLQHVLQSSGSRILGQRINRASLFAGVLGRRRDQEHRPKQNGQKAQEHSAPAPTVGRDHGKGMVFRLAETQIFFPGFEVVCLEKLYLWTLHNAKGEDGRRKRKCQPKASRWNEALGSTLLRIQFVYPEPNASAKNVHARQETLSGLDTDSLCR